MPHDTISPLKGNLYLVEEHNSGAYYYAYSPVLSTSKYTEAFANIVLPRNDDKENLHLNIVPSRVTVDYSKRHAFISMGIFGKNGGVDLGITYQGDGWHPCYYDTTTGAGEVYNTKAPENATNAIMVVKPLSSTLLGLYVQFLDANGNNLVTFDEKITVQSQEWVRYYRFASLVPGKTPPKGIVDGPTNSPFHDNQSDSTFMTHVKFTNLSIYNNNSKSYEPWGIYSSNNQIITAFIMSHPKCQVTASGNSETSHIDHWGS